MDKELQQDWFGEDLLPEGPVLTTNSEHVNIQAFDQDTLYQEDVLWEAELEDTTERINSLIRALGVHDEPIIRTPISSSDRNEVPASTSISYTGEDRSRSASSKRSRKQTKRSPILLSRLPTKNAPATRSKTQNKAKIPQGKKRGNNPLKSVKKNVKASKKTSPKVEKALQTKETSRPTSSNKALSKPIDVVHNTEVRIAGQIAAISALQSMIKEKQNNMQNLQDENVSLQNEVKKLRLALELKKTNTEGDTSKSLVKAHEQNVLQIRELYEKKIKMLQLKDHSQLMRNQQLLEKMKSLSKEKELAIEEKEKNMEAMQQLVQTTSKLKNFINICKDRLKQEVDNNTKNRELLEEYKATIDKSRKTESDLKHKVNYLEKDHEKTKSSLATETSQRKIAQNDLQNREAQQKDANAQLEKLKAKCKKTDIQKEKMFRVIKHLKYINRELMSVLLAERAAQKEVLSADDADNPSLLPQVVRLLKQDDYNLEDQDFEPQIESIEHENTDFYKSLKDKYQEAKAAYRTLAAKTI